MSICNKCPDKRSCDDCLPVHTNVIANFCKWAIDHIVNEEAVFIAHNSSTYDAHFMLFNLITHGEHPENLVTGVKLL